MALKRIALFAVLAIVLAASQAEANIVVTIGGTINGNNNANSPPFAGALVNLVCSGNVTSFAITNANGSFSITMNPIQMALGTLLSSCKLAVATPNGTNLSAPLQYVYGSMGTNGLNLKIKPGQFQLV